MLPEAVRTPWPVVSELTVGLRPERAKKTSVASTRRLMRPAAMSWRPPG